VRDGASFTLGGSSRIQEGDQLLVVTTENARAGAEQRLRSVDRSGRLARWRGDAGGTPATVRDARGPARPDPARPDRARPDRARPDDPRPDDPDDPRPDRPGPPAAGEGTMEP
jgi:hypothetical protein